VTVTSARGLDAMGMNQRYTKELRDHTNYLAIWLPNVQVAPGDLGRIKNHQFTFVGRLSDFDIAFEHEEGPTLADFEYFSKGAVSVDIKLAGDAPAAGSGLAQAEAGLTLSFSREHAVAFRAADCRSTRIANTLAVGRAVLALDEKDEWPDDVVVVTEVIEAGSATILIASSKGGKIDLRVSGTADVHAIHIADAEAGLGITRSSNMGMQVVAESGLTPLIRTSGVRKRFLRPDVFRGRAGAAEAHPGPPEPAFVEVDYADYLDGSGEDSES
jgi:hypothetical protein